MESQQEIDYKLDLFTELTGNAVRPSDKCKDVNQTKARQARQINKEGKQGRALTSNLMEIVCSSANLKQAYKRVERNNGVAGIDQMPTEQFAEWFRTNEELLRKTAVGNIPTARGKRGGNPQTQRRI